MASVPPQHNVEDVSATDIIKSVEGDTGKSDVELKKLTPTQQAGMYLASGVGCAIFIVIIWVFIDWYRHIPLVPQALMQPANTDDPALRSLMQNYNSAYTLAAEQSLKLFDSIVVKALLPVFTTILGYIFGSRAAKEGT